MRNPIILQPERSRLKFPGPGTAFRWVQAYFNPWTASTLSLALAAAFSVQQPTGDASSQCTHGDKSFAAGGPQIWNNLPSRLRHDISYGQFKRQLRTFLFRINWHIVTVSLFASHKYFFLLTYLFTLKWTYVQNVVH